MAMESLLYVSESRIQPGHAELEVRRILETAHAFNASAGITGALIFTGTHFAQLIEGDVAAVTGLIDSISRDRRHARVDVVARGPLVERRFTDWSMAYNGPSQFVSGHVARLLNDQSKLARADSADWLTEVLQQFSRFRDAVA